ncbi:MAG: hypothetical protein FWC01_09140 [Treponema sp.]|nr:hypothetical protein [Treponema sp.]MCL2238111.1 hypothetical protein [Treponema sp.]
MKKNYESEALKVCHQSAQNLFKLGVIDENEMKNFDNDCISPTPKKLFKSAGSRVKQNKTPVAAASH